MNPQDNNKPTPNRASQSWKLYPAPKTAAQKSQEDMERKKMFEKRLTKRPALKISLFATILFEATTLLLVNLYFLWFFGQLAGISFSFVGGMLLLFTWIAWYKYALNTLYSYGKTSVAFFSTFSLLALSFLGLSIYLNTSTGSMFYTLLPGIGLFFTSFIALSVILKLKISL